MLTTSNILTAFMLGGWIAVTPAALAAGPSGSYTIHSGTIQGNAQYGDVRMAGSLPVGRIFGANVPRNRRWGAQTQFQRRHAGGSSWSNLNQ